MGKFEREQKPRKPKSGKKKQGRDALGVQIEEHDVSRHGILSTKSLQQTDDEDNNQLEAIEEEMETVPANLTAKIFKQAQEQQAELSDAEGHDAKSRKLSFNDIEFDVEEIDAMDEEELDDADVSADISPEDEAMLSMYMSGAAPVRRTLADLIMEKIREKEERQAAGAVQQQISEKVQLVYSQVGTLMSRFRSGKLPKALKVIPSLKNWEEILHLTRPEEWTAQALAAITRLFASNFNSRMAQRFYNLVLLPRIRSDIETHKKLNFHLYMAMRKAVFKPAAFFKGIVLPLAEDACTAREAVIVCSILARISIPMMHSGAAILKLSQMSYSGPACVFIKTLLNKKYSLPYQVISGLMKYFDSFASDDRVLPVIWHQMFLVFAQRYKNVITPEHKERLKQVLRKHEHHQITAEIRRELFSAPSSVPKLSVGDGVIDRRAMSAAIKFASKQK